MSFDLDDEENEATRKMNGASKERKDENHLDKASVKEIWTRTLYLNISMA